MTTIRVPERVVFYMSGTGWAQGGDEAEVAADPARQAILAAMRRGRNADGSISLGDPSERLLGRLWLEGDYCADGYRYGDKEPDNLADYNAGLAMCRRAEALLGRALNGASARALAYAQIEVLPTDDDLCAGDPSHQHHTHDDDPDEGLASANRGGVPSQPTATIGGPQAMTAATKTCPGFAPDGIAPHTEPADLEHFNSNRGGKDGLSTRCRDCGNRYGKAWAAAKKRGEKFSVKAPGITHPDGSTVFTGTAEQVAERAKVAVVSPLRPVPKYHDDLALRAHRGKAEGYQAELVGDTYFALPVNGTISTDEGQAALEALNEAQAAERRRRDAERKRIARAAAKEAAANA